MLVTNSSGSARQRKKIPEYLVKVRGCGPIKRYAQFYPSLFKSAGLCWLRLRRRHFLMLYLEALRRPVSSRGKASLADVPMHPSGTLAATCDCHMLATRVCLRNNDRRVCAHRKLDPLCADKSRGFLENSSRPTRDLLAFPKRMHLEDIDLFLFQSTSTTQVDDLD